MQVEFLAFSCPKDMLGDDVVRLPKHFSQAFRNRDLPLGFPVPTSWLPEPRLLVVLRFDTIASMKRKHQKTLELIFSRPVSGNIKWRNIEVLLIELGA